MCTTHHTTPLNNTNLNNTPQQHTSSHPHTDQRADFPITDPPAAASAVLLRDIHTQLVEAVEGKIQSVDWRRKKERGEYNPSPWSWVERTCLVLKDAPLNIVDSYTKVWGGVGGVGCVGWCCCLWLLVEWIGVYGLCVVRERLMMCEMACFQYTHVYTPRKTYTYTRQPENPYNSFKHTQKHKHTHISTVHRTRKTNKTNKKTQAIAMELEYGDYNNLNVEDRVHILSALVELAVNSELLRDAVVSRVEGEYKSRAAGAGGSLVGGEDVVGWWWSCGCFFGMYM